MTAARMNICGPCGGQAERRRVHKRRRRKRPERVDETQTQTQARAEQTQTQEQIQMTDRRRHSLAHRAQRSTFKLAWLALIISQLLCDMSQDTGRQIITIGVAQDASSDSDSAAGSEFPFKMLAVNERNEVRDNEQRFLKEPQDVFAIVGQPEVAFSCVVLSRSGSVVWKRSRPHILSMNLDQLQELDQMWVTQQDKPFKLWALANGQPHRDTNSSDPALEGAQADAGSDPIASNFTLHLRNVNLENDDLYQCSVLPGENGVGLQSRKARLSVLKTPDWLTLNHTRTFSLQEDSNAEGSSIGPEIVRDSAGLQVVQLEENERLRLECSAGPAKPRAEIVWLDGDTNQPIGQSNPDDANIENRYERREPSAQLESTTSVLSVRVDRHKHHNKVYTCQTQHKAYELAANGSLDQAASSGAALRPLRQSVQLIVNYRPRVELHMPSESHPSEGHEVRLNCHADARPPPSSYKWFIDGQHIEGANEAELVIGRVSRQLHLRVFMCVARNSRGTGQDTYKLAVQYGPAYVTHLLPASLQPEFISAGRELDVASNSRRNQLRGPAEEHDADDSRWIRPASSGELAVGVTEDENITLHCDFDSYPRVENVTWFKISTDYLTLHSVTPDQADDLIEHGAIHALFKGDESYSLGDESHYERRLLGGDSTQEPGVHPKQAVEKKHVAKKHARGDGQLDYQQMSNELHAFLKAAASERKSKLNANATSDQWVDLTQGLMTQLTPLTKTNSHLKIREQLRFAMLPVMSQRRDLGQQHQYHARKQLVILESSPDHTDSGATNETSLTQQSLSSRNLSERSAQLTSSSLVLDRVDHQQVGKYVCVAKSPIESEPDQAKAIFLVLKREPRIISVSKQVAPLVRLQVECLAQVNTVLDDKLNVSWFKSGKLIKEAQESSQGLKKSFIIKREVSPDALFIRSTLTIDHSDGSDFGQYECKVSNSLGTDWMQIKVEPTAPIGLASRILIHVILVSLFCLICVGLIALALCTRTRPKSAIRDGKSAPSWAILSKTGKKVDVVLAAAAGSKAPSRQPPVPPPQPQPNSGRGSSSPSSQSNQSTTKRSINSSEASTTATRQLLDVERESAQQQQQQRQHQSRPIRPESALGPSSLGYCQPDGCDPMRGRFARASLRSDYQTPALRSTGVVAPPAQSNKFAAIHETLENKLNFAGLQPSIAQVGESQKQQHQARQQTHEQPARKTDVNQKAETCVSQEKSATGSAGFIARSWNRFVRSSTGLESSGKVGSGGKTQRGSLGRGSSAKGRPTISMPINQLESLSETGHRSSSLSGSLTHIGAISRGPAKSPGLTSSVKQATMMRLNHMSVESSLVSSKANLIQDSGTASDGTTSSGRSSSTSQNLAQRQTSNHSSNHLGDPGQLVHQLAWTNQLANCNENTIYANSANLYDLANDQQSQASYQQAMMNHYGQYQSPVQHQQRAIYIPNQMEDLYQQQIMMQTQGEHYQLPTLMSESYLDAAVAAAAGVQQQDGRSFYATLCNAGVNKPFGQHQHQQQQFHQMNHNGHLSLDDLGGYGSLQPARVHFEQVLAATPASPAGLAYPSVMPQQPKPMVKIVDEANAEAHFESNYGSLLSRSYKTLGYNQQHQPANNNGNLCRDSSASSSPNSLTTHANMSNTISAAAVANISQRTPLMQHQQLNNSNLSTSHHLDHNLDHQDNCQQQAFALAHDKVAGDSQHVDANQVICDKTPTVQRKDGPDQMATDSRDTCWDESETPAMNNDRGPQTSHPSNTAISCAGEAASATCEPQRHTAMIQSSGLATTTTTISNGAGNGENSLRDHPATHV